MEKLSDTKKRNNPEESGEAKPKRSRSGGETLLYLSKKAEQDHKLKEQEVKVKGRTTTT